MSYYVYTMVRRDLTPEQRAVQACHASFELGLISMDSDMKNSTLILLGTRDEESLRRAREAVDAYGVKIKAFYEPDMQSQMTSWSCIVEEEDRKYFESFKTLKYKRGILYHFVKFIKTVWKEIVEQ